MIKDSVFLIPGGTGSFGHAMVNLLLTQDIKEIRILSRDEKKQDDMRKFYQNEKLKFYIGDVRDRQSVDMAMGDVDYVFYAAALKQVPSCEFFPLEAVKTNIFGADNVIGSAIQHGAKKLVVLSTDKAVYPINAMGQSKALMEKVMIANSRRCENGSTVLCGTRYGNVMASRGSVIPLFVEQIKGGQPLTITDPEMTRFLMSLDDAVQLVLFAFKHGCPGDIFVQKSPASTILDLAKAVNLLFQSTNEIRFIGTRHGEKKHETLVTREEMQKSEELENYFRIPADSRNLNYDKFFEIGDAQVDLGSDYTSANTRQLAVEEIVETLLKLDYVRQELVKL